MRDATSDDATTTTRSANRLPEAVELAMLAALCLAAVLAAGMAL